MISIIICSRKKTIPDILSTNINETIGCAFELIIIDNSKNLYSIFEAYNLGIDKSVGAYLCFIHDDILFHTHDWGNIIKKTLDLNDKIGLVGVAGSKIKSKMPSGWWNCPDEYKEINIIQHISHDKIENWNYGFKNVNISEVVTIDGVFMIMKRSLNIFFNTALKGFHNYDLNISLECQIRGFKVAVTNEILIEHYSNGTIDKTWYKSTLIIHKMYRCFLPLSIENVPYNEKKLEFNNGSNFVNQLLILRYYKDLIRIWFRLFEINPFSKFHLIIFKKLFLKMINYKCSQC